MDFSLSIVGQFMTARIRLAPFLVLILAFGGSNLCQESLGQGVRNQDWGRMLGPNDDAKIPAEPIRFDWTGGLPVAWNIQVGEGYGNAVISNGRMFHFDRYGNDERLTCYDADNAKVVWAANFPVRYRDSFGYNNGPRAMPVANAKFVASYGATGHLAVMNAATGEVLWEKNCSEEYGVIPNFFGVGSTPLIHRDKLLVMVGGSPSANDRRPANLGQLNRLKGSDSGIVAFDLQSGKEVYRVGSYLASYAAPAIHEVDGKRWCFAFMREGLMVFDPDTGKEADFSPFRAEINESVNAAWPVVNGNEVFISETYELGSRMLHFANGKLNLIWADPASRKNQSMRAHWATPVLIDGILYGSSGRNEPDSDLRAVDWEEGKMLWSHRTHARGSVIAIGEHLIVVDEYGVLQLIKPNSEKMEVLAEQNLLDRTAAQKVDLLGTPVWAPPVYANGLLVLRGGDKLVALRLGLDKASE